MNKIKQLQGLGIIVNLVLAIFAFGVMMNLGVGMIPANPAPDAETVNSVLVPRNLNQNPLKVEEQTLAEKVTKSYNPAKADVEKGWKTTLFKPQYGNAGGAFMQGAVWGVASYWAAGFLGDMFGLEPETTQALQAAVGAGVFTWRTSMGFVEGAGQGLFGQSWLTQGVAGLAVGAIVFVAMYERVKYQTIEFKCQPWEAPYGGADCEKCNDGVHECSEYRCKSLGLACGFKEQGAESVCYNEYEGNVKSPGIRAWEEILTTGYRYTNLGERPPNWGTGIVSVSGGKIAPFTPITFGIQTNMPAHCKIGLDPLQSFEEMPYSFGGSNIFKYNHSQSMSLPTPDSIKNSLQGSDMNESGDLVIQNSADYLFYVRCISPNGRYNADPYVIQFSVDDGPDATAPLIKDFSIKDGSPVQYGVDSVPLVVYLNEPSICRWSRTSVMMDQMENEMKCSRSIVEMQANMFYACETTLTGVEDNKENIYYFHCEDQPWKPQGERNRMTNPQRYSLIGTRPLNIVAGSVRPISGERVVGGTTTVPVNLSVRTQFGYKDGEASCYYKTGDLDYNLFFETGSHTHSQRQDLPAGRYTYDIKCVDLGGNANSTSTTFDVFVDMDPPVVTRILYDGSNSFKILTDKNAECYYSNNVNQACVFEIEQGVQTRMTNPNSERRNEHLAVWDSEKTYFIKCVDDNGKMPLPTDCSAIVRPVATRAN